MMTQPNTNERMMTTTTTTTTTREVQESVIRKMTRLAMEYNAINLSQGFPNEAPPRTVQMALAHAVMIGRPNNNNNTTNMKKKKKTMVEDHDNHHQHQEKNINNNKKEMNSNSNQNPPSSSSSSLSFYSDPHHKSLLRSLSSSGVATTSSSDSAVQQVDKIGINEDDDNEDDEDDEDEEDDDDQLNQYSPPMGRFDVRQAVATQYYKRLYNYEWDPDNITITLGATEAVACALRSIGKPNDKVVIFEPFHELYPNQCQLFYLQPIFVTLRPPSSSPSQQQQQQQWTFDPIELQEALQDAKILLLNTPHNPTGKVFTYSELELIVNLCLKFNVYIVTDEIYEHMCFTSTINNNNNNIDDDDQQHQDDAGSTTTNPSQQQQHILLPKQFPQIAHQTLVCNSMGKSASATGWRLGWCLHPPSLRSIYRGIHDQLAVMSPHPMQYACLTYLSLPEHYFHTELRTKYEPRVRLLYTTLQQVGFTIWMPEGAYYLFVKYKTVPQLATYTPLEAALFLLQTVGVACVPGDSFYGKDIQEEGSQYLRFAACRSMKDLTEACDRLKRVFL